MRQAPDRPPAWPTSVVEGVGDGRWAPVPVLVSPPSTGLSTSALVLGVLAVLAGVVPFLFFVSIPLGTLALILGLVAYSKGRGADVPRGRAGSWLGGVGLVLGLLGFLIVVVAIDDLIDDEGETASDEAPAPEPGTAATTGAHPDATAGSDALLPVQSTGHTGGLDVTLQTVEDPYLPSRPGETPPSGTRLVAVEVTVTNPGSEHQTFLGPFFVELTDAQNRRGVPAPGSDLSLLDPVLPPGQSRDLRVVFSIPADADNLSLRVKGNITARGITFRL